MGYVLIERYRWESWDDSIPHEANCWASLNHNGGLVAYVAKATYNGEPTLHIELERTSGEGMGTRHFKPIVKPARGCDPYIIGE